MKVKLDRKEFDKWLKFYGYTQKELVNIINYAYKTDINYRGFNKMVNKKQRWTIEVAYGMAKVFEIPFEQLFYF